MISLKVNWRVSTNPPSCLCVSLKASGFEETGTVASAMPGVGVNAQTSTAPNHTYEMEAEALTSVGHKGFVIDAQAMASVLFDFAANAEFRVAVKKEFEGIHALFGEYQEALKKVYTLPVVPDPR